MLLKVHAGWSGTSLCVGGRVQPKHWNGTFLRTVAARLSRERIRNLAMNAGSRRAPLFGGCAHSGHIFWLFPFRFRSRISVFSGCPPTHSLRWQFGLWARPRLPQAESLFGSQAIDQRKFICSTLPGTASKMSALLKLLLHLMVLVAPALSTST